MRLQQQTFLYNVIRNTENCFKNNEIMLRTFYFNLFFMSDKILYICMIMYIDKTFLFIYNFLCDFSRSHTNFFFFLTTDNCAQNIPEFPIFIAQE